MLLLRCLDKGILQVPVQPPVLSSSFLQKPRRGVEAFAHQTPTAAREERRLNRLVRNHYGFQKPLQ